MVSTRVKQLVLLELAHLLTNVKDTRAQKISNKFGFLFTSLYLCNYKLNLNDDGTQRIV